MPKSGGLGQPGGGASLLPGPCRAGAAVLCFDPRPAVGVRRGPGGGFPAPRPCCRPPGKNCLVFFSFCPRRFSRTGTSVPEREVLSPPSVSTRAEDPARWLGGKLGLCRGLSPRLAVHRPLHRDPGGVQKVLPPDEIEQVAVNVARRRL
ncbi:hypothetical protein J1605_010791 [Eschrichtius robustus]|uniref:Uncharacterized protein n=1 Tax=Eschrichtius robustus TaxID=9764 RepID=A0AB34GS34_ESCRO|nr:hypothetical protein J1605_010791 [Eschrichtius robustus]